MEGAEELATQTAALASGMRVLRKGVWNPGPFVQNPAPQADVEFVEQVLEAIERYLAGRMGRIEIEGNAVTSPFDPDRYYLMGVGEGAMLGYRLIKAMPGKWAAFHAMGGAIGGQLFADGRGGSATEQDNSPDPTHPDARPVSLFVHHGGRLVSQPRNMSPDDWYRFNDLTVPPGEPTPVPGVVLTGQTDIDSLVAGGVMTEPVAAAFVPSYLPLRAAIDAYRALNGCVFEAALPAERDRLDDQQLWKTIYSSDPAPAEDHVPVVVEYRDERMNHFNYVGPDTVNRYITVESIWAWLYAHPRVP